MADCEPWRDVVKVCDNFEYMETATAATTGGHVWPAARRLLEYVEAARPPWAARRGARILELGAGTGWMGMTLAANLPNASRVRRATVGETVPSTSSALLTTASMTASNGIRSATNRARLLAPFFRMPKLGSTCSLPTSTVLFPTATALVMRSTSPIMTPAADALLPSMISTATHSPSTSSKTMPNGRSISNASNVALAPKTMDSRPMLPPPRFRPYVSMKVPSGLSSLTP
ncbi:predicted protein [Micromonas commoda]|uniref:Uncharacterized protein n=1 Tax=Micromonas commoda (strain RCC299 / NOUM17 / CCMP2709) TaxID=296587 RepID=C1EB16_MICCC|nr:predicted protein [Micromonas commoda]ACO65305.1 predicted protein [Micromonas commoda]|eukprot:XP_002504047.1 predicted protein [Micromonas commoda]